MKARLLVVTAVVAAWGCNAKSTSPLHPGISNSCTVTLSGAVTGTYDCQPAATAWSLADGNGGFSFAVSKAGTTPGITVAIVWVGEPTPGAYGNTDPGAQASLSVSASSGQAWLASVGGVGAASGSYILNFTSVVNNVTTSSGRGYSAEGTLTATLPAVAASGATGTVALQAAF